VCRPESPKLIESKSFKTLYQQLQPGTHRRSISKPCVHSSRAISRRQPFSAVAGRDDARQDALSTELIQELDGEIDDDLPIAIDEILRRAERGDSAVRPTPVSSKKTLRFAFCSIERR